MQTVKAILSILICVALLGACGLKGPLYLPDENPVSEPTIEQESTAKTGAAEDEEGTEDDEKKKPVPG